MDRYIKLILVRFGFVILVTADMLTTFSVTLNASHIIPGKRHTPYYMSV